MELSVGTMLTSGAENSVAVRGPENSLKANESCESLAESVLGLNFPEPFSWIKWPEEREEVKL